MSPTNSPFTVALVVNFRKEVPEAIRKEALDFLLDRLREPVYVNYDLFSSEPYIDDRYAAD